MNIEIELPDLGADEGDTATVSEWHFEEGDDIRDGEELLEVTTDTETIQVPCHVAGILVERLVEEDDLVRVGDALAIVETLEEEPFETLADDEE